MGLKVKTSIMFCSICALLFGAILLLLMSISITEIDEMALVRHKRSQEIYYDEGYALPGRHFVGIFQELITFKRNRILVNFANDSDTPSSTDESDVIASGGNRLACWTKDGTNVYIDLSYFITLKKEKLLDFYLEYGKNWLDFIVRLSYTIIKETTIQYTTEEFFTERNAIAEDITNNLVTGFDTNFNEAVNLEDLQLRKIVFDDEFEEATVNKLIQA
jgi:regulator of protease activity HflC (stomatin/prohibitin superfamily)